MKNCLSSLMGNYKVEKYQETQLLEAKKNLKNNRGRLLMGVIMIKI
jgi:hypothetical protein